MNRQPPQSACPWVRGPQPPGPNRARSLASARFWGGLTLLLLSTTLGCRPTDPESSLPDPLSVNRVKGNTQLRQALDFLNRLDEFDQATAHTEILRSLQEWLSRQTMDPNWSPDPLSQQLPDSYLALVTTDRLTTPQLEPYDALALQEATWLRDIARSVVQRNQNSPDIAKLLLEIQETVPAEQANDVGRAFRLFDWTVRNLQLDADVLPGDTYRLNSDVILYPWESLLFGRGTFAEKSRVFLLLCRQVNLPVVMLAIDRSDRGAAPSDWLPALLLGEELYLFDMRLGVPVPGPDGRGVATLSQVLSAPLCLEPLELFPDYLYPVKTDDLPNVVALIDATPPELSLRMAVLENALVGDQKLVLTTSPSTMATALANSSGVQGVGIWTLPYDGFVVRNRLQQNNMAVVSLALEHRLFDRQTPLASARILHFRGQYDSDDDRRGARALYLECRASEQQIRSIAATPLRPAEGESAEPPTAEQLALHEARLANVEFLMRRTKENASYWLGLMAFDRGEYGVSIDFLDKRLLQVTPQTLWNAGAIYNLGRAYEARGRAAERTEDLLRAQEIYEGLLDAPMAAAAHLRARSLRQELNPAAADQPSAGEALPPTVTD